MGLEQDKKYNQFKALFGSKLASAYTTHGKDVDEIFEKIAALDPSATAKSEKQRYLHLEWICSRIMQSPPRQQDLYKIREDLEIYVVLARLDKWRSSREGVVFYKPYVEVQIGQYAGLQNLSDAVAPYRNLKDRKKSPEVQEAERKAAESSTTVLYNGPEGRVVVPLTTEASQYWGKSTRWCISATKSDNLFEQYYNDGTHPIIMFLPKGTDAKFAFNEHDEVAARNSNDQAIYDIDNMAIKDEGGVEILGDFVTKVFQSPDFAWDKVRQDKDLLRTMQRFAMLNPAIHAKITRSIPEANIPELMRLESVVNFAEEYLGRHRKDAEGGWRDTGGVNNPLQEDAEQRQSNVNSFALYLMLKEQNLRKLNPQEYERVIGLVGEGNFSDTAVTNIISKILLVPDPKLESAAAYLKDYQDKMKNLAEITERCKNVSWNQAGIPDAPEIVYLKSIPTEFWADEQLALGVMAHADIAYGELLDALPEIFQHPKAWIKFLRVADNEPDVFGHVAQYSFANVPLAHIEGVPFLQIVADMKGAFGRSVIDDLYDALNIYRGFSHAECLDWTPIAKRLAEIYPDGFDKSDEVEMVSTDMPKCDLSKLLEKTIRRHPEFFDEVDPRAQTVEMIRIAVRHDPEALADVAARFFDMPNRPPELAIAFKRMVEMQSPFVGMVDQHFAPNGP